jgi:hypothetical protein
MKEKEHEEMIYPEKLFENANKVCFFKSEGIVIRASIPINKKQKSLYDYLENNGQPQEVKEEELDKLLQMLEDCDSGKMYRKINGKEVVIHSFSCQSEESRDSLFDSLVPFGKDCDTWN